jgi:hypothetical protein
MGPGVVPDHRRAIPSAGVSEMMPRGAGSHGFSRVCGPARRWYYSRQMGWPLDSRTGRVAVAARSLSATGRVRLRKRVSISRRSGGVIHPKCGSLAGMLATVLAIA